MQAIGIDLGGTKIAGVILDEQGNILAEARTETVPSYEGCLQNVAALVTALEAQAGPAPAPRPVGLSLPGLVADNGNVRGGNLPWDWASGRPFPKDLEQALGRPLRFANDADCFALSEARSGAAAGYGLVFGVIIGTGAGGGIIANGALLRGPHGLTGEWGHIPLPWRRDEDGEPVQCGCRRVGCIETWVAGAGLTRTATRLLGQEIKPPELAARVKAGDAAAHAVLELYYDQLARALTAITTILDPHMIVFGGGLSALPGLLEGMKAGLARYALPDCAGQTQLALAKFGPDSGMRGAAHLWLET